MHVMYYIYFELLCERPINGNKVLSYILAALRLAESSTGATWLFYSPPHLTAWVLILWTPPVTTTVSQSCRVPLGHTKGEMSTHVSLRDSSSSEEDSRPERESTMDDRKTQVTTHYHPFSVEAIMSGRKTHSEFTSKPDNVSVVTFSKTQNSPYLCRETYSPPEGIRKHFIPPSPVKSESSEPDDCAPWDMSPRFSAQTRE